MSMPRAVRHINETRLLARLFRLGPMSRAELGRELGLTRSTAGSLVSGLAADGVVIEDSGELCDRPNRTGRPGNAVRLNPDHAIFLGADVGVDHLSVIALDLNADVIARRTQVFPTALSDPGQVVAQLVRMLTSMRRKLRTEQQVRGLSVAVPGLLSHEGTVLRAPILGWRTIPLPAMLHERLPDIDTIVAENDANASAFGELYRARRSGTEQALYMFLDAGVGGGLVSNGQIQRGHDGYAGEIGHIIVGEKGFLSDATLAGSLESFVGREAVLARHVALGGAKGSLDDFIALLAAGDRKANRTFADWAHYLGRGIASLVSVLNPQKIVLSGPVAGIYAHDPARIVIETRKYLFSDHPLPHLELSSVGVDGPAIGAACLLHGQFLSFDEDLVFNGAQLLAR